MDVGLHLEAANPERNLENASLCGKSPVSVGMAFPSAETGDCFGPRRPDWRRLSELMEVEYLDDPDSPLRWRSDWLLMCEPYSL
jgi:hypothetical protein